MPTMLPAAEAPASTLPPSKNAAHTPIPFGVWAVCV